MIEQIPFEVAELRSLLLVGFAATSIAVAEASTRRGIDVSAIDDRPTDRAMAEAKRLGIEIQFAPSHDELRSLVAAVDGVAPSPGVPLSHPVFAMAEALGRPIVSELDLASSWSDVPFVAVTGTNGKTTVTTLVTEMLNESGLRAVAAGNNEIPLVSALDADAEVLVVEASSFRLRPCQHFRPEAGSILNLAPDHLDWHGSVEDYFDSKARIGSAMTEANLLVLPSEDKLVSELMAFSAAEVRSFGVTSGDYRWEGTSLIGPNEFELAFDMPLPRSHPHDLANASASVALGLRAGASAKAMKSVLESFRGVRHRLWLAGEINGVRYFDDSKATAPHATQAALSGFSSVVLIAGGRNKGLDLSSLRHSAESVHSVVAIGEAAEEIAAVFSDRQVKTAENMEEAVEEAAALANSGDVVLLSPACASFDWYENFEERGRDFCRIVSTRHGATQ